MSNPMKPTEIGNNKTGIATSPLGFEPFLGLGGSTTIPDTDELEKMRLSYCRKSEPVGTMPTPVEVAGVLKSAAATMTGKSSAVLLDKIGERLAYERAGVRLYEALVVKLKASHAHDSSITLELLEEIRDDELRHAGVLSAAIRELGGDPTALTPCADVVGVVGLGFAQAITDAKTTLTQCLGVMHMVEISDIAGWELLIELAEQLGHLELAEQFREAADEEDEHEARLREWVRVSVLGQADSRVDPEKAH